MNVTTASKTAPARDAGKTLSGEARIPLRMGLPKTIESICPQCLKVIPADLYEEGGKVMIEKECPGHGRWKDVYWGDAELYLRNERWTFDTGHGLSNPNVKGAGDCPHGCGLCGTHLNHTVLGNIDLTNRCNLNCPICFANANVTGYVYQPSLDQVAAMLRTYRNERPVAGRIIQYSGGEPTLHPQFFEILRMTGRMGFTHIQLASNGIRFADPEFAMRAKEAGLHTIYLQFDGLDDRIYAVTRGRPLVELKERAVENIRRAGMKIALVCTIVRGVNDEEVGRILRYAIGNADVIAGISFQPVCFTGRISHEERMQRRITLPDIMINLERQTGIVRRSDFYPLSFVSPFSRFIGALRGEEITNFTCHPHCTLCTYLVIGEDGQAVPMSRFIDVEGLVTDMNRLAGRTSRARFKAFAKIRAWNALRRHYHEERAPEGLSFTMYLQTLQGMLDKKVGRGGRVKTFRTMMVGGMHFMDAYNYDLSRLRRCVIHFAGPDGMLYPFCSYNSGPVYRTRVERAHAVPAAEWKKVNGYERAFAPPDR
ncbi:MAG: radical SAM protein [bacterium]|nr:radical SAM protein [bacterium]